MDNSETPEKIESITSNILLEGEEYQIELTLYSNDIIEFKVKLNNPTASCYYTEKYNLEQIKDKALLHTPDMRKVYEFYKRRFENKKINLLLSEEKKMYINYKITIDDEEIQIKLELKKENLEKSDFVGVLAKEVEQLKKKNKDLENKIDELQKNHNILKNNYNLLMEEHNKKKEKEKEEEQRKIDEEKKEEQRQKDEENFSAMNDNLNLNNNFEFNSFENIECKEAIPVKRMKPKTVAVYCIIKNNKRVYQIAYPKNEFYYRNDYEIRRSDIIIYNLITNKIDNRIYGAHGNCINNLKHYYDSFSKCHFLLSVSSNYHYNEYSKICVSVKLWKITSSNCIEECFKHETQYQRKSSDSFNACALFKDQTFLIFGGITDQELYIYDYKGNYQNFTNESQIDSERNFIEAVYIKVKDEDKKYILLSGYNSNSKIYLSESYDCDTGEIKAYYHNDNTRTSVSCMNFFKKGYKIFLIISTNDKVNIFNFGDEKPKKAILIGDSVQSLCSISQKYMIASNNSELKIIDMDKESVVPKSSFMPHYDGKKEGIKGIEKIKIPDKGEYIITYSENCIKIWLI